MSNRSHSRRRQGGSTSTQSYKQKVDAAREQFHPNTMLEALTSQVFTLASQKPQRPGNFDVVLGAIIEYLCSKRSTTIAKALRIGQYLDVSAPIFPIKGPSLKGEDETVVSARYEAAKSIYQAQCKVWMSKTEQLVNEKYHACEVILAQCLDALKGRLKAKKTYENVTEESDAVALLKLVKTVPMGMEGEGTS